MNPVFLTKRLASSLLVVSLVMAFAGCGSDGDSTDAGFRVQASTTVTTGSLGKPQFVHRVNQLCREGWVIILDNFTKYSSWQEGDGLTRQEIFAKSVKESFLAGFDFHVFDEIYRLGGPEGEEESVEDVIGALQLAVERGQRQLRVTTPAQLDSLFADYNRRALEYGFVDCLVDAGRVRRAQA